MVCSKSAGAHFKLRLIHRMESAMTQHLLPLMVSESKSGTRNLLTSVKHGALGILLGRSLTLTEERSSIGETISVWEEHSKILKKDQTSSIFPQLACNEASGVSLTLANNNFAKRQTTCLHCWMSQVRTSLTTIKCVSLSSTALRVF